MVVTVNNTTLFHVAALYMGDATLWTRIAAANGLDDPIIAGTVQLVVPAPPVAGRGGATS